MTRINFFFAIGLAIIFCGCGILWQRYNDSQCGFSISVPRLWEKQYPGAGIRLLAFAPGKIKHNFRVNFNVVVSTIPPDMNLDVFIEFNKQAILANLKGAKSEIEETLIYAGGKTGKMLALNNWYENINIKILTAAWVVDNHAYVISCSAPAVEFSRYRNAFLTIMRSLRINSVKKHDSSIK